MKRNNDLIVSQILEICVEGAYKTHVIYKANLNFKKADKYLKMLMESGLISMENKSSKVKYKTTEKGLELNNKYRCLQDELDRLHTSVYSGV